MMMTTNGPSSEDSKGGGSGHSSPTSQRPLATTTTRSSAGFLNSTRPQPPAETYWRFSTTSANVLGGQAAPAEPAAVPRHRSNASSTESHIELFTGTGGQDGTPPHSTSKRPSVTPATVSSSAGLQDLDQQNNSSLVGGGEPSHSPDSPSADMGKDRSIRRSDLEAGGYSSTSGGPRMSSGEMVSAVDARHSDADSSLVKGQTSAAASQQAPPSCCGVQMRHIALLLLVFQTVASVSFIRYSMTLNRDKPYIKQTFVFITELGKLGMSTVLLSLEVGPRECFRQLGSEVFLKPVRTLIVGVPALLYVVQNNLILVALDNLSGAVYQVTYQLKILTTALLTVMILRRKLSCNKWIALLVLTTGVALIQVTTSEVSSDAKGNQLTGLFAVLTACVTSGLAGVYLEKILKESSASIWLRNFQLALLSCFITAAGCFFYYGAEIRDRGFFQNYTWATWASILMQSAGGIIVAAVLKYADNILKCFGNAVAIMINSLVSWLAGDFLFSIFFMVGSCLVILATFQYSQDTIPCGIGAWFSSAPLRRPPSKRSR